MSTNAEDPTVLLPEIEVSDLVDAIPIDIVGELLTEDDATPSGGGARTTNKISTTTVPRTILLSLLLDVVDVLG